MIAAAAATSSIMAELPPRDGLRTLQQIAAARIGDHHALADLLLRYGVRLEQWLRDAGVKHRNDLEDLSQEVVIKLLRALSSDSTQWPGIQHFRAWVRQVATNAARDLQRRVRQRSLESVGGDEPVAGFVAGREPTPSREAMRHEDQAGREAAAAERAHAIRRLRQPDQQLL